MIFAYDYLSVDLSVTSKQLIMKVLIINPKALKAIHTS